MYRSWPSLYSAAVCVVARQTLQGEFNESWRDMPLTRDELGGPFDLTHDGQREHLTTWPVVLSVVDTYTFIGLLNALLGMSKISVLICVTTFELARQKCEIFVGQPLNSTIIFRHMQAPENTILLYLMSWLLLEEWTLLHMIWHQYLFCD